MNGSDWYMKWYWYLYVQIRYFLWQFRIDQKDEIFMQACTIKNFKVYKWETKIFVVARIIAIDKGLITINL